MANFFSSFGLIGFFYLSEFLDCSAGTNKRFAGHPEISNFGLYYIVSRSVSNVCSLSGPKDTLNEVKNSLAIYKVDRIREVFRGDVIVPNDVPKFKTSVSTEIWRDGGYKPFFYKMYEKPCEEGAVAFFLKAFFGVDKSCIVKKGNYTIVNVNPTDIMKDVIGNTFFYEKMSITLAWFTKKGFIGCVKIDCESKPLPKKTQRTRYNNRTTT